MRHIVVLLVLFGITVVVWACSFVPSGSFGAFYNMPRAVSLLGWFFFFLFLYWDIISFIKWPKKKWLIAINIVLVIWICASYIYNEWERFNREKAFAQECEEMNTFPLPRNEAIYSKNIKWIIQEIEHLFDGKDVDFSNEKFQECLEMAIDRFRGDEFLAAGDNKKEKVNSLTVLALLHFQHKDYSNACLYAKKALDNESAASLAQCIYATSYLYSKSAPNNERVQKEHLLPALLAEGDNKIAPHVLKIYLNRLMDRMHDGASKPDELGFVFELLNAPAFSKSTLKCVSNLSNRVVQEMKWSQNSIEVFAKTDEPNIKAIDALKDHKISSLIDTRYNIFVGLRDILSRLLSYMKSHENGFAKEYVSEVEREFCEFVFVEPKLRDSIVGIKNRLLDTSASKETEQPTCP